MDPHTSLKIFLRDTIQSICFRKVSDQESLMESGLLDSIGVVDLAVAIEEHYGVTIPYNMIGRERFETIERITELMIETGIKP